MPPLKTDIEFKKRLKKVLIRYGALLTIGFIYLAITLYVGYGVRCVFNKYTGLQCPGCGATRMAMALAKLQFVAAFKYNAFLFITGPFILGSIIFNEVRFVRTGQHPSSKWRTVMIVLLILALIYGVLRNIFPI